MLYQSHSCWLRLTSCFLSQFFVPIVLSLEDCQAWKDTDLQGKLELCSLMWIADRIWDMIPCLPIWMPDMPAIGHSDIPSRIATSFSSSDAKRSETLPGPLVGMIENKLFMTDAEGFKSRCVDAGD